MKVSELIAVLQERPQDAVVMWCDGENGLQPVSQVKMEPDYRLPIDVAVVG